MIGSCQKLNKKGSCWLLSMTYHVGWQKPFYIICSFFDFIKKLMDYHTLFPVFWRRALQGNICGGVLAAFFPFCSLNQGSRRAVYAPRVKTRPCEKGERGSILEISLVGDVLTDSIPWDSSTFFTTIPETIFGRQQQHHHQWHHHQ